MTLPATETTKLNLRGIPTWAAEIIDAEADAKGLSRESHRRSILIAYARKLVARQSQEVRRD